MFAVTLELGAGGPDMGYDFGRRSATEGARHDLNRD